jgi:hypothetical protein
VQVNVNDNSNLQQRSILKPGLRNPGHRYIPKMAVDLSLPTFLRGVEKSKVGLVNDVAPSAKFA